MSSTLPPPASKQATSSLLTQTTTKALTDQEALRLLSTHPGLAQQYQDLTAERLKEYLAVVDEGYKKRLGELQKDFESFKMAVSKLLNFGNDTQNGMNEHPNTLQQWKGPLHHGGGFIPELPELSSTWYRPAADGEPSRTQLADGVPSVPMPPNKITTLTLPHGSSSQTPVPTGQSITTERSAPGLVYLKVDGQLAGTFRLALNGLPWAHPGISLVLQASPAASASTYTGLICKVAMTPKLTDFVIERTPGNLMLLLEAHHQLRDRKVQLTTLWQCESGLPAPRKIYSYEGSTTPASKLWRERTRFKPCANLTVKVPLPGITDPQVAFRVHFKIQTRRLLFSRGVVQGPKTTKPAEYIDVLSGLSVSRQKDDIVLPESEPFLSTLAHFAKSLVPAELAAMELATLNHQTGPDDIRSASHTGEQRSNSDTSQAQLDPAVETAVSPFYEGADADALHSGEGSSGFLQRRTQMTDSCHLRSIPSWPGIKPLIDARTGADDKRPEATTYQVKPSKSRCMVNAATSNSSQKATTCKRAAPHDPAEHGRPSKSVKISTRSKIKVEPKIKVEDLESDHPNVPVPGWKALEPGEIYSNLPPVPSLRELQPVGQTKAYGHYNSQAARSSPVERRWHSYYDYDLPSAYEQHRFDRAEFLLDYEDILDRPKASRDGRPDCRASI